MVEPLKPGDRVMVKRENVSEYRPYVGQIGEVSSIDVDRVYPVSVLFISLESGRFLTGRRYRFDELEVIQ